MKRDMKKVFSFILAFMLVISLMPVPTALAIGEGLDILESDANPATPTPVGLSEGQIWTDKSVADNGDGTFDITLKAMGRDYKVETPQLQNNLDIIFVLDCSASMTQSGSTKLEDMKIAAKRAVDILIDGVHDNRIAVVKFNNTAVAVPETDYFSQNKDTLNEIIGGLNTNKTVTSPNGAYTNIQDGFRKARTMLNARSAQDKLDRKPVIILMSDGAPTRYTTSLTSTSWTTDLSTPNNAVWWAAQQGWNTKINGTSADPTDDIAIYTIGFGVGSDDKAVATLMPTEENTQGYRPSTYSGQKRTLTTSNTSANGNKAQFYIRENTDGSWPRWNSSSPTGPSTPSNIGSNYIPYAVVSNEYWTSFSGAETEPQESLTITRPNGASQHGSQLEWPGGQGRDYRAMVYDARFSGTQYRNIVSQQEPFNHKYWSDGSTITDSNPEAIFEAFVKIANSLVSFKPMAFTLDGDEEVYSPIIITDVLGDKFEVVGTLPTGVTQAGTTITWTIQPSDFTTMAYDSTTIDPNKVHHVTFKVKLSDDAVAGVRYETNATASAIFSVMGQNPYYDVPQEDSATETLTIPLPKIGWITLEGYEALSVEKAAAIEGLSSEINALFGNESFSFKIETKVNGDYSPYAGNYTLHSGGSTTNSITDAEGIFQLKPGEKAVFTALSHGTEFRITELQDESFEAKGFLEPSWTKGGAAENAVGGYITGTFELGGDSGEFSYICQNEILTMDIPLMKMDAQLETPISGAEFTLTGIEGTRGSFIAESDDGKVVFEGVPAGKYEIAETDTPRGYQSHATTYQALVNVSGSALFVSFPGEPGEDPSDELYVWNDPVLNKLRVEKAVKGADAPEMQANPEEITYDFELTFDNYFRVTGDIASEGAIYFEELNQPQPTVLVPTVPETTTYRFGLLKDGWIEMDVRDGVEYSLVEILPDGSRVLATTYTVAGSEDVRQDDGIYAMMANTPSAIIVQNHYGNDGLTIQKQVVGDLAPQGASYDFTAIFWTSADDEDAMESTVMQEAIDALETANASLAAIELNSAVRTAVNAVQSAVAALESANQVVTDAAIALAQAQTAYDTASASAIELQKELDELGADKTELTGKLDTLDPDDPEKTEEIDAIKAEIDALLLQITALETDMAGLNVSNLAIAVSQLQEEYDDAILAAAQAQTDLTDAENTLAALNPDTDVIQAYLDAKEAVEDAQENYNQRDQDKWTNILKNILDRVIGFFKNLIIGDNEIDADIVYSSVDNVELSAVENTSQSAFSLKHGEEIVFNFDTFFLDSENEDKEIHFAIVETKANAAKSVDIDLLGLEDINISGASITGTITAETDNVLITYTNHFDNRTPPGPDPGPGPGPGGRDDDDGGSSPSNKPQTTIPDQPTPAGPVPDGVNMILEEEAIPAGELPKTGGTPALLLYGLGALLAGSGLALRRKEKKM